MHKQIVFQHSRKTGGTTVRDLLLPFFARSDVSHADEIGSESVEAHLTNAYSKRLVYGHMELLSAAPQDCFKFALFRAPYTRLLSERRQWMQASAQDLSAQSQDVARATVAFQKSSLIELLNRMLEHPVLVSSFWNYQSVTMGAWPLIRESSRLRTAEAFCYSQIYRHFEDATALMSWLTDNKSAIEKRSLQALHALDYVGLVEDIDTSVRCLFDSVSLPQPLDVPVTNARSGFTDEQDAELRVFADRFLELDFQLYEAAKEQYAVQKRSARGAPADYLNYSVPSEGGVCLKAEASPNGHGWQLAHRRGDGLYGRWAKGESEVRLVAPAGHYRFAVELWGADSEARILNTQLWHSGVQLAVEHKECARGPIFSAEFQHGGGPLAVTIKSGRKEEQRTLEVRRTVLEAWPQRSLGKRDSATFGAEEAPAGHGWHRAHRRSDGEWCRWTKGGNAEFSLYATKGSYRIKVELWGAIDSAAIDTAKLMIGDTALVVMRTRNGDRPVLAAEYKQADDGLLKVVIVSKLPTDERALEVRNISMEKIKGR